MDHSFPSLKWSTTHGLRKGLSFAKSSMEMTVLVFGVSRSRIFVYVWGESSAIDERTFRNRIPARAPKVINDAIEVTLNLGYRYLWVDRYCIPIDHAAKHAQLRNMGDIYSNSDLTIIAAAGDGPGTGLPGVRATPRKEQISTTIGRYRLCLPPPDIDLEIELSRWNKRGWTYQEGFLSRRQLVFTESQTYFQCRQLHYPEQFALPSITWRLPFVKPSAEYVKTFATGSLFRSLTNQLPCTKFSTMVNEYSRRELTFKTDILDAFKGILRVFESLESPVQNLCGVPLYSLGLSKMANTDALVYGLSWNPAPIDMPLHAELWREMTRRKGFPSWSWIGWQLSSDLACYFHLWPLSEILSERGFALNNDIFKALVQVGVGFSDGSAAPWESERDTILQKYQTGVAIQFLELAGWVFTIDVPRHKYTKGRQSDPVKIGPFTVQKQELATSCSMLITDGPTVPLTCIALSYLSTQVPGKSTYNSWLYKDLTRVIE
ncbi:hypothetical protein CEP54_011494 [Fusarium duplospermum]|uniref:Heterokaryon incompatibility domain-containing protein n=1 Tax=Fusarium duplospermum TaxID=1325734 RepID=A0A428PDZ5_9HYPO|nr:hypothetical protein CEP54_011494 [Fusarium duplospermum]